MFLLDTGSDACTIPYFKKPISEADGKLHCANGSVIHTFGTENLTIDLGLNKTFTFDFIKADIQQPIIGADFLDKYGLWIDIKRRKLIDPSQKIERDCLTAKSGVQHIKTTNDPRIERILKKYPDLVAEEEYLKPPKHSYVHEIPTTGTLPSSKPRRLSPKMYELCKEKFNQMLKSGLISPSKSPNSSAIHVVPKQNDIRICGDFRELNRHIPHDSYPISFMSDFVCELYGKRIFSSLDIKEAYHNIPIKNSDKHKTTITSPL